MSMYAVVRVLTQALDASHEEVRKEALDAICAVAVLMGPDFQVFMPVVRRVSTLAVAHTRTHSSRAHMHYSQTRVSLAYPHHSIRVPGGSHALCCKCRVMCMRACVCVCGLMCAGSAASSHRQRVV